MQWNMNGNTNFIFANSEAGNNPPLSVSYQRRILYKSYVKCSKICKQTLSIPEICESFFLPDSFLLSINFLYSSYSNWLFRIFFFKFQTETLHLSDIFFNSFVIWQFYSGFFWYPISSVENIQSVLISLQYSK